MQRFPRALIAGVLVVAACSDNTVAPIASPTADIRGVSTAQSDDPGATVSTSANSGPGSFRAAVEAANVNPSITSIRFANKLGTIALVQPVTFSGTQALAIDGKDTHIDGDLLSAGEDALIVSGGGDLTIRRLVVRNAPGIGIKVLIPATRTGVVSITLQDVAARANGEHGVLINDQPAYLIDPESTSPAGSDAGLRVRVSKSSFENNGFASIDQDGFRVNEGGLGDIDAVFQHTRVIGNGGDGVELDERGAGSVIFTVEHTQLIRNGGFTEADFDDGIDVDEEGDGGIDGNFNQVEANNNFEQGVDLNENNAGDLRVFMNKVDANDNAEEGIEFEEDDDFAGGGDIIAVLQSVTTLRNGAIDGDAGLKLREKGVGNLSAQVIKPVSSDNAVGGMLFREDAAGTLDVVVENAVAGGNGGDGIKFDENSAGNLAATVLKATASNNAGAGVAAEQALAGTGLLQIQDLTATGNANGAVKSDAGVVVQYLN